MPRPSAGAAALTTLAPALDRAYDGFNLTHSTRDPIWTVRRFSDPADREVVAFIASALAFGRVQSVLQTVDAVLGRDGTVAGGVPDGLHSRAGRRLRRARASLDSQPRPRRPGLAAPPDAARRRLDRGLLRRGRPSRRRRDRGGRARVVLAPRHGPRSRGHLRAPPARARRGLLLLASLVGRRVQAPQPVPALGRAPRRRGSRPVEDASVRRSSSCRSTRTSSAWGDASASPRVSAPAGRWPSTSRRALRRLAPDDPVRYDFSMCHIGMMGACGFGTTRTNAQCPLHAVCRPRRAGKGA